MRSYRDNAGRRRCLECDAFLSKSARRCRRCDGKREREIEAERAAQEQLEAVQSYQPSMWRRRRLESYVQRVLELRGGRRLEFFERNPVGDIFR